MASLPGDSAAWHQLVHQYGLADKTLSQIGQGDPVSGSKLPFEAMLQLRAIWLDQIYSPLVATSALQNAGYFDDQAARLAAKLLKRTSPALGLDKVFRFIDYVALNQPYPKTPKSSKPTGSASAPPRAAAPPYPGYKYEGVAGALQAYLRLQHPSHAKKQEIITSTPKVYFGGDLDEEEDQFRVNPVPFDLARVNDPRASRSESLPQDFFDGSHTPPSTSSSSPSRGLSENLAQYMVSPSIRAAEDRVRRQEQRGPQETARHPLETGDDGGGGGSSQASAALPIDESKKAPGPTRQDPRVADVQRADTRRPFRTPYEVQTSVFFFSFISSLKSQFLPLSTAIDAVPEEFPYRFGIPPIPARKHPAKEAKEGGKRKERPKICLFTAVPDGSFSYVDHAGRDQVFAWFELKPFARKGPKATTIAIEETAEIASVLFSELGSYGIKPQGEEGYVVVSPKCPFHSFLAYCLLHGE